MNLPDTGSLQSRTPGGTGHQVSRNKT